jgi:hypothetical protein
MADITTPALTTLRREGVPSLTLPRLRIGNMFLSMGRAIGQAMEMAYVSPYRTTARRPPATDDANLEGRDPNW